jgi:hypothetical protein
MRDLDEASGSDEENFQSRPRKAQKGGGINNGNGKTSKAAAVEDEGPA